MLLALAAIACTSSLFAAPALESRDDTFFAPGLLEVVTEPANGLATIALSMPMYEAVRGQEHVIVPGFVRGSGEIVTLDLTPMQVFSEDARIVEGARNRCFR